ncbi:hypothetical protein [Streptomyces sp. 2A115]|uniref:hypothetical protein n=1 Tax=Streptomyces sp. 2A115 TaxID=3457439 RepID=UPI003FD24576
MIVTLIVVCEVAFWVLLAAGLAARYLLKMPRTGLALLLCEPLLEVVLFTVTAIDLRNGAEPDWKHGLAAVYIGFTVGLGHSTIKWADAHVAHRFAGGPPPVKPPKYGMARARHEWLVAGRWITAAVVAMALLQAAIWYVGSGGETDSLRTWQSRMLFVIGINLIIALSYTVFPKKAPYGYGEKDPYEEKSALPARDPEHVPDLFVGRPRKDEQ